ncbi:MAG: hypothetical protein V1810_03770 [Candidatus Beckwithbacteria bacterium]
MKSTQKKVLILASAAGGGHLAIASALEQYLRTSSLPIKPVTFITTPKIVSPAYRLIGEHFIKLHHQQWQKSNNPKSAYLAHLFNTQLTLSKIVREIRLTRPDLIISTSGFATFELRSALDYLNLKLPHLVVLADPFTIHHGWTTYKQANHYLVPTPEAKQTLIYRHIPANRISLTGLPLRLAFYQPLSQVSLVRKKLGLNPNKLTLFIGGSGEGHGQIYPLITSLLKLSNFSTHNQLIVVAGKNRSLLTRLKRLPLNAFGYTDQIPQLIAASDFVVGKPGPNILFESLMLNKPFIATSEPLCQELGNYRYITRRHLGIVTHRPLRTLSVLKQIIKNPAMLKSFQPGISRHRRKYLNTPQKTLKLIHSFLS